MASTIVSNDNWRDTQEAEIIATGLAPTSNLESAILITLNPGAYTAIVEGKNNTTGISLVEVFDLGPATSQLANISTRAFVSTGDQVVIGGFILGESSNTASLIILGLVAFVEIGPDLTDPTLELRDSNGALLVSNDDWQDDPIQAAQLIAHGLAPQNPRESGIYVVLQPGLYTAILAGKNGHTGVGLVEIYNLN